MLNALQGMLLAAACGATFYALVALAVLTIF